MWLISCCVGKLRVPLELPRGSGEPVEFQNGSQASFNVVRGNSGLLLSHCSEIMPNFGLKGDFVIFLELWQEARASSQVVTGVRRNVSSCQNGVKPPFQLPGGTWDCSLVATRPHLWFGGWGADLVVFFCVAAGSFGVLSSCKGNLGKLCSDKSEPRLLPSCEGELGIAVVSLQ